MLPLQPRLKQNFLFGLKKLIEYWAFVANVVSPYPCVGTEPRIEISSFSCYQYEDEFISAPKIMAFFPMLPSGNENVILESNPIP